MGDSCAGANGLILNVHVNAPSLCPIYTLLLLPWFLLSGQWSKKSNGSHVAFPREIGSDIERRVNIPVLDLLLELNSICIFFSFIWYSYTKDVAVEQVSAGKTKKSLDMSQCDSTLNLKVSNQWYSFKNCLFNILHICSITFKINKGSSKGCSMYITEWKPYRS